MRTFALIGFVVVALCAAAGAGADGGGRATALLVARGSLWTTVPGGLARVNVGEGAVGPPTRSLVTRFGLPGRLAACGAVVWGLRPWTLVRLDLRTPRVRATAWPVPGPAYAFVCEGARVWVSGYESGRLVELDARTGAVRREIAGMGTAVEAVAVYAGSVWVVSVGRWRKGAGGVMVPLGAGTVTRVDARSGRVLARVRVGRGAGVVAVGGGAVWVANTRGVRPSRTVSRIDVRTNRVVATVRLRDRVSALTFAKDALWALTVDERAGTASLTRVGVDTNRAVTRPLRGARFPAALRAYAGSLWVADEGTGSLFRVNQLTGASARIAIPATLDASRPAARRALHDGSALMEALSSLTLITGWRRRRR